MFSGQSSRLVVGLKDNAVLQRIIVNSGEARLNTIPILIGVLGPLYISWADLHLLRPQYDRPISAFTMSMSSFSAILVAALALGSSVCKARRLSRRDCTITWPAIEGDTGASIARD